MDWQYYAGCFAMGSVLALMVIWIKESNHG